MTDRTPKKRAQLRLETLGEWFAAAPPVKKLADETRLQLDSGVSEEVIRARIRAAAKREGLLGRQILLPSFGRKVLRYPIKKALHELVDFYLSTSQHRKVGDWVNTLMDNVGGDRWFEDYILGYARTGKPPAAFSVAVGKVWTQPMGKDAGPTVWAVATELSDPQELVRDFIEQCATAFPESRKSRYGYNPDAARYFRLHREGLTDAQIAEQEIGPEELERLRRQGPRIVAACIQSQAERIHKLRHRFWTEYLDSLFDELSDESE